MSEAEIYRPKVGSLYSGCSATDYGLIESGCRISYAVETDTDACETYKHNIGPRPIQVRVESLIPIAGADCVVGGPPCQTFSRAGSRSMDGLDNIKAYANWVLSTMPKYFVMENADTFLEMRNHHTLQSVINLFHSYVVNVYRVSAEDYGLPQQRERAFFLGYRKGCRPFLMPKGEHWSKHYSGWAEFLNQPYDALYLRRGNQLKGNTFEKPAFTVMATENPVIRYKPASKLSGTVKIRDCNQRYVTMKELAKLQGFPDDYEFVGNSKSVLRQIGNAWAVPVAEAIGRKLIELLN